MKLHFEFIKLESKAGCLETIEILLPKMDKIDPFHIIKITRPDLDEDRIKQIIANKRRERMEGSLFAEEVRAEMEVEIKISIKDEIERIRKMPNPIIFVCEVSEVKYKEEMVLKAKIPKNIAKYFLEYKSKLDEMFIELEQVPIYMDEVKKAKSVLQIFNEFAEATEDIYEDRQHREYYKNIK